MDINDIKKMMRSRNDKVVIIENGKPIMVVMPYEGYEQISLALPELPLSKEESKALPGSKAPAVQPHNPAPQEKAENENDKLNLNDLPFL